MKSNIKTPVKEMEAIVQGPKIDLRTFEI